MTIVQVSYRSKCHYTRLVFHIVENKMVFMKVLESNVYFRFADTVHLKCRVTSLLARLTPLFFSYSLLILEPSHTLGLDRRDMQRNCKANSRYQFGGHRHKAAT
jgi:hypothetical protein